MIRKESLNFIWEISWKNEAKEDLLSYKNTEDEKQLRFFRKMRSQIERSEMSKIKLYCSKTQFGKCIESKFCKMKKESNGSYI